MGHGERSGAWGVGWHMRSEVGPQEPASCRYIPAYLAIDRRTLVRYQMIRTSSVIAMNYDAGPYMVGRVTVS